MPLFLSGLLTKHPVGKRFEHTHDGYKAVVIVGHDVVCYGNGFIVNGTDKVDGKALARACAIAMKVTNETMSPKKKVNYCVFHFLGQKAFNKICKDKDPTRELYLQSAHPARLPLRFNLFGGQGAYSTVMRCNYMKSCVEKGQLAVHQLVHILSHASTGNWDNNHKLWTDPETFVAGKNLNRACEDKWIYENDTK